MPIRVLSDVVAAQIAAGEVIERPASVIKELLENAIDAGAKRIEVEVEGSGVERLRVVDDGHGILAAETALALVRHATSKLESVDDLNHIYTLGFRGEALASIASVSHLTLTSRHQSEETGTQIIVEGGHVVSEMSIGTPIGTSVEMRNLFYNVPARRKFLKSEVTERRHVTNLITRYAMAYPDIRFALYEDGREQFRTSGNGHLGDTIVETMGLELFRGMVEIRPLPSRRPDLPPIRVWGYSTHPKETRANRSQIILFVNGRSVQDQRLTYAVVQAYHTLIPQGRYPISVMMIELPPDEVDVNVHPTKAEVRFRAPDAVFSAVQHTIRHALMESPPDVREVERYAAQWTDEPPKPFAAPPYKANPEQLGFEMDHKADLGRWTHQNPESSLSGLDELTRKDSLSERRRSLPPLRIIGQVAATYIIAEGPIGMYLIDQHAAHERIMYEKFMTRHEQGDKYRQHTLAATVIQLPKAEARFLEEHLPILQDLGFEIEFFGNESFRVMAVPSILADHPPEELLKRVLQDIEGGDEPAAKDIEDKIVRRVCKTASVKAGQILSYDEMMGILRQLERCEQPLTCPHGRPTMIHLSNSDLAKEFGRS